MKMKKDATESQVNALNKATTNKAPESALGSDKANRSGAPSLRYHDDGSIVSPEKATESKDTTERNETQPTTTGNESTNTSNQTANTGTSTPTTGSYDVVDSNKDSDGVTHFDGTGNKGTKVQYNGALNASLVAQQNDSGTLLNRFRYRASGTFTLNPNNGNTRAPFGGTRLADNEAQPYRIINIENYEFGVGVVDNAGGTQKDSTTVKLTQRQPDGSAYITLGAANFATVATPSIWLAVSLADLSATDKSTFDAKAFNDKYIAGFEVTGSGATTSSFAGQFEYTNDGIVLKTNIGGMTNAIQILGIQNILLIKSIQITRGLHDHSKDMLAWFRQKKKQLHSSLITKVCTSQSQHTRQQNLANTHLYMVTSL